MDSRKRIALILVPCTIVLALLSIFIVAHALADDQVKAARSPLDAHLDAGKVPLPLATATPPTWAPPGFAKAASVTELPTGAPIRFTLVVHSPAENQATWHDVVITDPLDPAFRIDAVTVPAGVAYSVVGNIVTITKPTLAPGESIVVYIDCTLIGPADPGLVLVNQALLEYDDPDGVPQQPISTEPVEITVAPHRLYLPLVARQWPLGLAAPALSAIDNPGNDGAYNVAWSVVAGAEGYLLEEALSSDFTGAATVYTGPSTTYAATGRQPTRYFYRVRAYRALVQSGWSNAVQTDVLWELEPNDDGLAQANGPLLSGLTYYGLFPQGAQSKDYYYFDLPAAHSVEIWLTNIPPGNDLDLVLREDDLTEIASSTGFGNVDENIVVHSLPPARYKVQVFHSSGPGNASQAYHLRIVYR